MASVASPALSQGLINPASPPWRDPNAKPYLQLVDVVKEFGDTRAVDGVSLNIYKGEFFALLGPSGCGKTTLLRMLAGFETPTSGKLLLDGQDLSQIPPHKRPVNMMFQSYALFPHMSVAKNIAFGLEMDRMPKADIDNRVAEMLALVKLEKFANRKPHQLSGGQRQRVALARALAKKPKLLLLDEPLGALDKKLREETQFELVNIQESLGLTFVIVTHDQEEAMTVSTRIAVMDHGRLAQVGTPSEIYENPASRYVANFLGDVNLFDGIVSGNLIRAADYGLDIRAARMPDTAQGASIGVALRPEKLLIDRSEGVAQGENTAEGVITEIAYLGDMSVYRVQLASGKILKVARTNRARSAEQTLTWGDKVRLTWPPEAVVALTA